MKKTAYILIFIILTNFVFAQKFENMKGQNGKFVNNGTFKVLKPSNVTGLPDTVGGKVEFLADDENARQVVPNVTYNKLVLKGKSRKEVEEDPIYPKAGPLATQDSFLIENNNFVLVSKHEVHAKGYTNNTSDVRGSKEIILNRTQSSQQISGNGRFSKLAVDNSHGVDVVNGGGFTVTENLRLQNGELRNSALNNFNVGDSVTIQRTTSSSLAYSPNFEGRVNVEYSGAGNLTTGPEIPDDESALQNLYVMNTDSMKMTKDINVNNELYVGTHIHTGDDTLSLPATIDPEFNEFNSMAEIHGAFARPGVIANDTMILNNPYTFAYFNNEGNLNGVYKITSIIYPQRFPDVPDVDEKVARSFELLASDENGNRVDNGFNMAFGYAWRASLDPTVDETFNMNIPELILQKWNTNSNDWEALSSDENAVLSNDWVTSVSRNVSQSGIYGIGMPLLDYFVFRAKIFLQGAYNKKTGEMNQEYFTTGLMNKPPVNEYPYNLTSFDYTGIGQIPDSAVDWVVLEFREDAYERALFYKTAFVDKNGKIINPNGEFGIKMSEKDGIAGNFTNLNVIIRHRNHIPVMTKSLRFDTANSSIVYDFTRYSDIATYLSEAPGQLLQVNNDQFNNKTYAIPGGFIYGTDTQNNNTSTITEDKDYFISILNGMNQADFEGYSKYDFDMNGILTTRDFNIRWNNRNQTNNVTEIQ